MKENSLITKFVLAFSQLSSVKVLVFGLVISALYFFMFYDSGATIEEQIVNSTNLLEVENTKKVETQKVLKKEEQMKSDVLVFAQKYEEIKSKIPIEFLESELRIMVDKFAIQNGLTTVKAERGIVNRNSMDQKSELKLIDLVSLNYTFKGDYTQILNFVNQITSQEKLIKIGDFNLSIDINNTPAFDSKKRKRDLVFVVQIIGFKQAPEAQATNALPQKGGG